MAEDATNEIGDYKVEIYPHLKRGRLRDIYKGIHSKSNQSVIIKEREMYQFVRLNIWISEKNAKCEGSRNYCSIS